MDAQFKSILKWILLLPASFVVSMLAFAIGSLIGYISSRMFIFGGDGRWIWAISKVIANVLAGYAFVYTGAQIAPKHKLNIAIILAALLLVILTVGITLQLVFQFASGLWEQIEVYLGSIMAFIGALAGYGYVKNELNKKE